MAEVTVQEWLTVLRFGGYRKINGEMFGGEPNEACAMGVMRLTGRRRWNLLHSDESGRFLWWRYVRGLPGLAILNDVVYRDDVTFDRLADHLERDYIEWKAQR